MLLVFGVAGIIGNFSVVKPMNSRPRGTVILMSGALAAAATAMPLLGGSKPAAAVILIVWGAAYGALPVALQMWIFTSDGRDFSSGIALFPSTYQLSITLGSLLGGVVVVLGGNTAAMLTGAAVALVTMVVFAKFAKVKGPALAAD
jgi:predicted MFS family arabinose efflux permease